ncbi:MAG: BlaI/MecI/CopY family transcriptional regulator [Clostridia bacterium]|nr:BlaI/MecI/CopY family transcriptional regulator [Clostridia bacterium]
MDRLILSDGEWKIMNVLWDREPMCLTTLVSSLEGEVEWTKSTVFVMLKRLVSKGAVGIDEDGKTKLYHPLIGRTEASLSETDSFLKRVYNGSIGMMLSSLAGGKGLSENEISELRRILDEAERDNK